MPILIHVLTLEYVWGSDDMHVVQVDSVIWCLCLCPPFFIAALMLMRDGLASFFPW